MGAVHKFSEIVLSITAPLHFTYKKILFVAIGLTPVSKNILHSAESETVTAILINKQQPPDKSIQWAG